jgi:hypothetical protein
MTTLRTHFAYRIDPWDILGDTIIDHVAGIEDLLWLRPPMRLPANAGPGEMITLQQGAHVIEDSSKTRLA